MALGPAVTKDPGSTTRVGSMLSIGTTVSDRPNLGALKRDGTSKEVQAIGGPGSQENWLTTNSSRRSKPGSLAKHRATKLVDMTSVQLTHSDTFDDSHT